MATAEVKLRTLANANPTLVNLLGDLVGGPFRWYDTQHVQGSVLPAVTVRRVSTVVDYRMTSNQGIGGTPTGGRNLIDMPRFQIDLRASDPETGRAIARAVMLFLDTLNLAVSGGAIYPGATPQPPCFVLNVRDAMDYQLNPPVWVQSIDVRLYNLEE